MAARSPWLPRKQLVQPAALAADAGWLAVDIGTPLAAAQRQVVLATLKH